jgi:hypothetical protein
MFGVTLDEVVVELERRLAGGPPRRSPDLARWLAALSEFDKAQGWFGSRSCAEWLAARCSMPARTARTYVRVARRLEDLPRVERALHDGRMSYAKVATLCRVATPDSEEHLLLVALATRDCDFALVIAEVEKRRRLAAVVAFDPATPAKRGRFWRPVPPAVPPHHRTVVVTIRPIRALVASRGPPLVSPNRPADLSPPRLLPSHEAERFSGSESALWRLALPPRWQVGRQALAPCTRDAGA